MREEERDAEDRQREQQEIEEEKKRKEEEEQRRLEELKKEEERKNRAKSRFTEITPNLSKKIEPKEQTNPISQNINLNLPPAPPPQDIPQSNNQYSQNAEYYVPQNAPEGAIPLRIPGQVDPSNRFKFTRLATLPPPPPGSVPQISQPIFNPPPPAPSNNPSSAMNAFHEASLENPNGTSSPKANMEALNQSLKQLEAKRKEIEELEKAKTKESKVKVYTEEDRKELIEKVKKIYKELPSSPSHILEYPINWEGLIHFNVIDVVIYRIIAKRVKDILKVEEQNLIKYVVEQLKKRIKAKELKKGLHSVLDDEAGEFVVSVWKAMIYECKKIDQGIITEPF